MGWLRNCVFGLTICSVVPTATAIHAQERPGVIALEEIVVTASRLEEPLRYSPDSVTVIPEEEIRKKDKKTVVDALRSTPGVFIPQNGSFGGGSYIYLRGTSNAHTLIMIDGIKVGDPMAPDGKMSISSLSTANIERIEIVRGAQSVLYGSDAMGGVINIITKKGAGKPEFYVSAEGGSFETFREKLGISGASDRLCYSASISRLDTAGISKADENLGNTEQDSYHETDASARLDAQISETIGAGFSFRHDRSKMDYDNIGADADNVECAGITSISGYLEQDVFDWWRHSIKLGASDTKREYTENGAFAGTFKGNIRSASWQHDFFVQDQDTITAGFDHQEESGDIRNPWGDIPKQEVDTNSFFVQNKWTPTEGLSVTLGGRHDDHQTFGGENTYKAALAYLYEETGTKVRGSYGTGFRAPSLYQLYSPYGDPNLKPEESKGFDAGIDQELFEAKVALSATYFQNRIDDAIDWNWNTWKYYNVGKVESKGWETSVSLRPVVWLSFEAHYTYTEAKDETPGGTNEGNYLRYRPRHTGGASVNVQPLERLNLNLEALYTGKRYENADNTIEMPAYTLVNLAASYEAAEWLQIFGRIDNLTDKSYQSVYGWGEPGIGFYGGMKVAY